MEQTKETTPWWKSKGVVGGLVTVLVSILGIWKIQVDPDQLTQTLVAGSTAVTGAIAMWGRIAATKKIG